MTTVPAEAEATGGEAATHPAIAARSAGELFWRRLRRDRVALAGLAFIARWW